jgi:Zn-dependent protease
MEQTLENRPTFGQRVKKLFAPVLVALAAAWKWILIGLKLPFLKAAGWLFVSLFFYAMAYGWPFAVGFVLLIFIHEMGHVIAARIVGLKVSLPYFIPFMGAVIALREAPRNAWIESVVGVGGPLLGSIGAAGTTCLYFYTGHPIFLILGYTGFLLNLFNLIPIVPLDGGRIVSAISPWLWVVGLAIMVPYLAFRIWVSGLVNGIVSVIILIIVLSSLPRVIALFRHRDPQQMRYFECTPAQRTVMAALYFGLIGGLYLGMGFIKNLLPSGSF